MCFKTPTQLKLGVLKIEVYSTSKSENLILITGRLPLPYCTFAIMISNASILRTQFSWILLRKQKRCTGMNEDCELKDYYL